MCIVNHLTWVVLDYFFKSLFNFVEIYKNLTTAQGKDRKSPALGTIVSYESRLCEFTIATVVQGDEFFIVTPAHKILFLLYPNDENEKII